MVSRFLDRDDIERLLQNAGSSVLRSTPAFGALNALRLAGEQVGRLSDTPAGFLTRPLGMSRREQQEIVAQRQAGRYSGPRGFGRLAGDSAAGALGSVMQPLSGDRPGKFGAIVEEATTPMNYLLGPKAAFAPGASALKRAGVEVASVIGGRAAAEGVMRSLPEDTPEWARLGAGLLAGVAGNIGTGTAAARVAQDPLILKRAVLEETAEASLPDSFEGAIDAVKRSINREMALRRRGVVRGEVATGRKQQAANMRQLYEEGQAQGLQGAELEEFARKGRAVGPMRRTVTEPLDATSSQVGQLYNRIDERYKEGALQVHDRANAAFALNKLVKGEGIMPHERRLLRNAIPELADVIDEVPQGYQPPVSTPRRGKGKFLPGEEPDVPLAGTRIPGSTKPRRGSARGLTRLSKDIDRILNPEVVPESNLYSAPTFNPRRGIAGAQLPGSRTGLPQTGGLPDQFGRPSPRGGQNIGQESELSRLRDIKIRQIQGEQFPTFDRLVERAREAAVKFAPAGKAQDVANTIEYWLNGSVAQIEKLADTDGALIGAWNKHVLGGTQDSAINAAFYQRNTLNTILRDSGMDPKEAGKVTDDLFQALISKKWDPENLGHYPDEVAAIFEELKGIPYDKAWGGFDTFVQRMKNTAFGLDAGFSFFGVQGLAALWRGSPQLFFGALNRAAGKMSLPGYRELYTAESLPQIAQAAADGVHFGLGSSPTQALDEVGSMLSYVPLIGRKLDMPLQHQLGKATQFFFGTVGGVIKKTAYEGALYMDAAAGRNIADPLVRQRAADNANMIGSFARTAIRASRSGAEGRSLVSPAMSRARIKHIETMARVFDKGNPDQQILSAMTILSTVAMPLLMGKMISDWFGVGEYQMDPTKPGWGQLTFENGRVIDTIPQDSIINAVRKSVDALAGRDPEELASIWTQFAVGQTSHPVRAAAAIAGVGYEPGAGFRMGGLTGTGQIANSVPIPPFLNDAVSGVGLDIGDVGLETIGLSSFEESATALERRILERNGVKYDQVTASQRREILRKAGYLEQVEAKRSEERHRLAEKGDRAAMAMLLGEQNRAHLAEAQKMSMRRDGTLDLAKYRELRSGVMARHAGATAQYRDIFEGFSESTNPTEQLVGQYWDAVLKGSQNPDGSLDFDKFNQLEAKFANQVGKANYDTVMSEVHAIDPRDNPAEQRLQMIRQKLDSTGYWEQRDQAWEKVRTRLASRGQSVPGTLEEYAEQWVEERAQRLIRRGLPEGVAYERAQLLFQGSSGKKLMDGYNRKLRTDWIKQNRALAQEAIEAGYLSPGQQTLRAAI